MYESMKLLRWTVLGLATFAFVAQASVADARYGKQERLEEDRSLPGDLREVGFDQRLGEDVPLDLTFTDEAGEEVRLGKFFGSDKPVVLALVYYECPMLCDMILSGLTTSLEILNFD